MPSRPALRAYPTYSPEPSIASRLTPRQHQLATLLVDECSIVDAAKALGMTVATARHHVKAIALRLPNPHGLPALRLIQSYGDLIRRAEY